MSTGDLHIQVFEDQSSGSRDTLADRQTGRQTDRRTDRRIDHNTPHPYQGGVTKTGIQMCNHNVNYNARCLLCHYEILITS